MHAAARLVTHIRAQTTPHVKAVSDSLPHCCAVPGEGERERERERENERNQERERVREQLVMNIMAPSPYAKLCVLSLSPPLH